MASLTFLVNTVARSVAPVVGVHRVQDLARLLAGGGRVQVDQGVVVDPALQDREVGPDGGHVQRRGRLRHRGSPGTGAQVVGAGSLRQRSYPSASSWSASSGPPDSTTRPSTITWTMSGEM